MFQMTIAPGGFITPGRLLIYRVSHIYWIFFIVYVWGITFAVVRIISAIFLKETLAAAASDQENAVAERLKKKNRDVENLRRLFQEADVDGTGSITMDEFTALLDSPQVKPWLSVLELEVREVDGLFQLLD